MCINTSKAAHTSKVHTPAEKARLTRSYRNSFYDSPVTIKKKKILNLCMLFDLCLNLLFRHNFTDFYLI